MGSGRLLIPHTMMPVITIPIVKECVGGGGIKNTIKLFNFAGPAAGLFKIFSGGYGSLRRPMMMRGGRRGGSPSVVAVDGYYTEHK